MNEKRHISEEDLSAYLDGQLAPDEAAAVEQVVADDPDMARELESLRQMRELIGGLEPEPAPVDMADRVLRRVHARRRPRNRLVVARWVTIAATLLVVFGGAMVMLQTLRHETSTKDSQEERILAGKSPAQDQLKAGRGWSMAKKNQDNELGVQLAALDKSTERDEMDLSGAKGKITGRIPQEETVVIYVDNLTEGQKAVEQVLASNAMELVPVGQKQLALNQAQNFAVPSPEGRANVGGLIASQNETVYLANATPRQNDKIVSELRMQVIARQSVSQLPEPIYNSNISLDVSNGAKELMKYQDGGVDDSRLAKKDAVQEDKKKPETILSGEAVVERAGGATVPSEPMETKMPEEKPVEQPVIPATPEPLPKPSATPVPGAEALVLEPVKPMDTYERGQTKSTAADAKTEKSADDAAAKAEKYKELWKRREENLAKKAADRRKLAQETEGVRIPASGPQRMTELEPLSRPASMPQQQQLRIILRERKPVTLNASQRENLKQAEMDLYQQNQLHPSQLRILQAKDAKPK